MRQSQSLILKGNEPALLLEESKRLISSLVCPDAEQGAPCGLCALCRQIDGGFYPFLFLVEPRGASNRIQIGQIRELQAGLLTAPGEGLLKAVVILDAHRMGEESQNCLLKTLEEPPERTLILLLTGRPYDLLPTIRSRCQTRDVRDAALAPDLMDRELALDVFASLQARGYSAVFDKASFVEGSRKKKLPAFLGAMEALLRDGMVGSLRHADSHASADAGASPFGPGVPGESFIEALQHVWRANYLLERNVNALLVLECLFLHMYKGFSADRNIRGAEGGRVV